MTDSTSINMKPGAAILMALALITTTFAGVSYADPTTGNGSMNTIASMDYDELDMIVDFDANGTTYSGLTAEIHVYDDDGFSAWFGPEDMMEESDNTSWNTHWADISLALFFEGSIDASPMADEGTWYSVDAYVNDSYDGYTVGHAFTEICMANGSVCEMPILDTEAEDIFNEIDVDGDGAITEQELIDFDNEQRNAENESPLNNTEETELLEEMAMWDIGWTSMDGNDTEDANDSMLEFNEFLAWYNDGDSEGAPTTAEFSLSNGYLYIWFYEEGDWSYATVELQDNNGNTVYNGTSTNSSWSIDMEENNLTDDEYWVQLTLIHPDGTIISIIGSWVSDYDYDQMMFDMFDLDGNGNISIDEYIAAMEDGSNETVDEQTKSMITNLFMGEDVDGDQELNMDEFSSFVEAMNNMGEGDEGEYSEMELMMMMLDTNQDGNISLAEILSTMVEEDSPDSEQMTTLYTNMFNNEDVDENALLDAGEFAVFVRVLEELDGEDCYEVMVGDAFMEEGEFEDEEGNYNYYMVGDTAPSNGTYCVQTGMDSDMLLYMYDIDGDDHLSLTEILAAMSDENSTAMDLMIIGWVFESYDDNSDQLLGPNEFGEFIDRMDNEYDYQPTPVQMMDLIDTDGDGSVSMDEIVLWISAENEEPMSEIEKEYLGIMFMMFDADANAMLNASEFPDFYYAMQSQDHDNGGDDGGETNMVCYDTVNHVVVGGFTDATSCETAGHVWTDMSQSSGGDDQNNADTEDEGDEIDFMNINVMFEQWHDDSMELVIIELAIIDNAEEIARLSMMADSMYGNNDSVLDESEVDMLMALYAMNLDIDDISKGMTLDGQNGTAVDFWVEIDGLLEGDDVVFIRVGTVIEFPTTAYDNSTAHTFVVMDQEDDQSNETMNGSMENSENCQDFTVWIHNSETWNVDSATGFALEETNNAWYADECALDDQESLIFTLSKVENATLPTEEEDDWTWEDEEMNMFPVCDWYYAVTFANGSMMEDQWMQDAPESGDYMITLVDNASYDIYVKCWDPEQGKMVVDITSPLGNSSNTSLGYAMGYISFKLPAGTGGNVTFDVTWTDGYYTESGTLTVYATGDGTIDLSDIEVAESEGLLPGFTAAMGVLAMLGAAMIAGRRNRA